MNTNTNISSGQPPYRKPYPTFIIDGEWLEFYTNRGFMTAEQAAVFGIKYPLERSWRDSVVGKRVDDVDRYEIELLWNLNRMAAMRELNANKYKVVHSESSADDSPSRLDLREDEQKISQDEIEYRPDHGTKAWR